ncbi:MAG: hypothetical protein AAF756_16920 [Pseudomonadota bacterium]
MPGSELHNCGTGPDPIFCLGVNTYQIKGMFFIKSLMVIAFMLMCFSPVLRGVIAVCGPEDECEFERFELADVLKRNEAAFPFIYTGVFEIVDKNPVNTQSSGLIKLRFHIQDIVKGDASSETISFLILGHVGFFKNLDGSVATYSEVEGIVERNLQFEEQRRRSGYQSAVAVAQYNAQREGLRLSLSDDNYGQTDARLAVLAPVTNRIGLDRTLRDADAIILPGKPYTVYITDSIESHDHFVKPMNYDLYPLSAISNPE